MISPTRAARGAALMLASLVCVGLACPIVAAGTITKLSFDTDLLTLEADDVSVAEILSRLVDSGSMKLIGRPAADARVSIRLERVPLDEALKRVLRDIPYIASYDVRPNANAFVEIRFLGADAEAATDARTSVPLEPWVAKAAASSERSARVRAIQMLKRQRSTDAREMLIGLLRDDPDPVVRESAAAALAEIGSREVVSALTAALSDPAVFVRFQAVRGLARIERDAVADMLIRIVDTDPNPPVRRAAVEGLGRLSGDRVRQALARAANDADPATRALARAALTKTSSPSPTDTSVGR